MKATVELKNEETKKASSFSDYSNGQGYVDEMGEVRVRIDSSSYVHVNGGDFQINNCRAWPQSYPREKRTFRIIIKEI